MERRRRVKSIASDLPEEVAQIIDRCIEPDREKRYQTSEDLAADLSRLDDNGILIPLPRRLHAADDWLAPFS
jgi:serine/threonine protein kinase